MHFFHPRSNFHLSNEGKTDGLNLYADLSTLITINTHIEAGTLLDPTSVLPEDPERLPPLIQAVMKFFPFYSSPQFLMVKAIVGNLMRASHTCLSSSCVVSAGISVWVCMRVSSASRMIFDQGFQIVLGSKHGCI